MVSPKEWPGHLSPQARRMQAAIEAAIGELGKLAPEWDSARRDIKDIAGHFGSVAKAAERLGGGDVVTRWELSEIKADLRILERVFRDKLDLIRTTEEAVNELRAHAFPPGG